MLNNLKFIVLWVCGIALTAMLSWLAALAYLGYCIISILLYMALICPYCAHYQGGCPSGYHLVAARLFKPKSGRTFAQQFRSQIALMLPTWLIPPIVGGYLLVTRHSWTAGALTALFCLCGFVLLPIMWMQVTCKKCKNAEACPWQKPRVKPPLP